MGASVPPLLHYNKPGLGHLLITCIFHGAQEVRFLGVRHRVPSEAPLPSSEDLEPCLGCLPLHLCWPRCLQL